VTQKGFAHLVLFGVVAVIILSILALLFGQRFFNTVSISQAPKAVISGELDLNGPLPPGATIALGIREIGTENFEIIASKIQASDKSTWSWPGGITNKTYDVQAYLQLNGTNISASKIITVTAPATGEVLTINYQTVTTQTPAPVAQPQIASISGTLNINGLIPQNSVISIQTRVTGTKTFNEVVSGLPATDGTNWSWNGAQSGQSYDIKGLLEVNGQVVGEGIIKTVVSPAANESLTINSSATAPQSTTSGGQNPAATGTISGTINLNGTAPAGSSIVVYQRVTGTSQFNAAQSSISPNNGATWTFSGATNGTSYDIVAVLKFNGSDLADSSSITVPAPASNEVLTLNFSSSIPAPSVVPNYQCVSRTSNNQWNVTLTYNAVPGANSYWLELGSSPGGNDITNVVQTGQGNQTVKAVLNGSNQTYFARYAVAYCSNCQPTDPNANYSAFSQTAAFACPP
jgi:hypothetical protein